MPLIDGDSDDIVKTNYDQLRKDGFGERQSWAIALKKARKKKAVDNAASKVAAKPRKTKSGY